MLKAIEIYWKHILYYIRKEQSATIYKSTMQNILGWRVLVWTYELIVEAINIYVINNKINNEIYAHGDW